MNAPTRTNARPRPGAAPARRGSATMPATGAESCRHIGVLLGLLLALAALLAHGSQNEARAQERPESAVLDSAIVPASANWVVLDATGTSAWRAQGESLWREFELGEVLPPGCEIETGPDGEVVLVAGGDQLVVAPHGRLDSCPRRHRVRTGASATSAGASWCISSPAGTGMSGSTRRCSAWASRAPTSKSTSMPSMTASWSTTARWRSRPPDGGARGSRRRGRSPATDRSGQSARRASPCPSSRHPGSANDTARASGPDRAGDRAGQSPGNNGRPVRAPDGVRGSGRRRASGQRSGAGCASGVEQTNLELARRTGRRPGLGSRSQRWRS